MKTFSLFLAFIFIIASAAPINADICDKYLTPAYILDAGHGGADGGAPGINGVNEKDLNLKLTLILRDLFYLAGIPCVLTRDTDNDTDGDPSSFDKRRDICAREEFAAKYPEAALVSIHMNSSTGTRDRGFQVFFGHKEEKSVILAEAVYNAVSSSGLAGRMREVKKAPSNVYLMKNAENCAVLVECGFISNAEDCALLTNDSYLQRLAVTLFSAFSLEYANGRERG